MAWSKDYYCLSLKHVGIILECPPLIDPRLSPFITLKQILAFWQSIQPAFSRFVMTFNCTTLFGVDMYWFTCIDSYRFYIHIVLCWWRISTSPRHFQDDRGAPASVYFGYSGPFPRDCRSLVDSVADNLCQTHGCNITMWFSIQICQDHGVFVYTFGICSAI